jgi:hypothetical protein
MILIPAVVFMAALAAEMVSFWICISLALFDFLSPSIVFPDPEDELAVVVVVVVVGVEYDIDPVGCCDAGGVGASEDPDDFGAGPGSAVIRSINVVPDEES